MSEEELKAYYILIKDTWEHIKKYHIVEDTDQYWKDLVEDTKALCAKHEATNKNMVMVLAYEFYKAVQQIHVDRKGASE